MSDALKAAAIVVAFWIVATAAHDVGFAAGLRAAPEYVRAIEAKTTANDVAWASIVEATVADGTCRQIRDLVLEGEVALEPDEYPSSPHSD